MHLVSLCREDRGEETKNKQERMQAECLLQERWEKSKRAREMEREEKMEGAGNVEGGRDCNKQAAGSAAGQ